MVTALQLTSYEMGEFVVAHTLSHIRTHTCTHIRTCTHIHRHKQWLYSIRTPVYKQHTHFIEVNAHTCPYVNHSKTSENTKPTPLQGHTKQAPDTLPASLATHRGDHETHRARECSHCNVHVHRSEGYIAPFTTQHSLFSTVETLYITAHTTGTQLAALYREVPLIQRYICTQLCIVGTADSVLIREVSLTHECSSQRGSVQCVYT